MKRLLIPVALLAVVGAVIAVNAAAKGKPAGRGGHVIHVIEHATSDAVTNGTGDQAGNVLTFANPVFDRNDANQVGSDQGYCVRIVVGETWECNWTTFLPGGQITVEGPFSDKDNTVVAITGGTGKYRNARGSMELEYAGNPSGSEFDFVFHVIG